MPYENCLSASIKIAARNLEDLYTCIRLLAKSLCSAMECIYPDRPSWIIAGDEKCLVKVTTPQPLRQASGSNLLPAVVVSSIEIACSTPGELINRAKTIFSVIRTCERVGTTLSQ